MIESKFTVTLFGAIPHLEVFTDYGLVRAPVLVISPHPGRLPTPVRAKDGAGFLYVLPCGQRFQP